MQATENSSSLPQNAKGSATTFISPLFVIAIAIAIHFAIPYLGKLLPSFPADYAERILLDMAVAMVAAMSLTIVNGFTGQFSIGHAAFMALGGYAAAWVSYYMSLKFWGDTKVADNALLSSQQMLLIGCALIGGLVAAGAGWLVGLPSLRLRGDYLAIVTLGFGEILRVLIQQTNPQALNQAEMQSRPLVGFSQDNPALMLPPAVGGSLGFTDIPKSTNLFLAFLFVGATFLFAYRLKFSSYGRALLSIREDEVAAEAMGINVTRLKVRAFMFAAFFAGIAGAMYAHQPFTTLRPIDAGFQRSFDIVMMVVLGGLGSISGALLAAIIITGISAALLGLTEYNLLPYRMPVFALGLILLMIFRPKGLFGIHELWDYLPGRRRK